MNKESDLDLDLSTVVILIFNPLEKRVRVSQMKFHICITRFLPAGLVHYILFCPVLCEMGRSISSYQESDDDPIHLAFMFVCL